MTDSTITGAPARLQAALALALAMVACQASADTPAPDVATDAKGAWAHFLGHATLEAAYGAYDVLDKVGYTEDGVVPSQCKDHAGALKQSLAAAPVSVVLHRAAMLCADATGDEAGAERELQAVASLAKLALAGASDAGYSEPIRVLRYDDVFALVAAAGLEWRYKWYERRLVRRTFPLVVATWDPERKVERHLRFDWIDSAQRIARAPEAQYPFHRMQLVFGGLEADAKRNDVAAIDALAIRDTFATSDAAVPMAKLRMATEAGGVQSPWVWISLCSNDDAPANCADGLVDALLPLAEQQYARPMMLLAYAYANGMGVPRDERAAMQLLDAADKRWPRAGASVEYASLWDDIHGDAAFPEALAKRLAHAVALGNEDARRVQLLNLAHREHKPAYSAADVAYLSARRQNGQGEGYELLAADADDRKDVVNEQAYRRLAADAGDGFSQALLGSALLDGEGVERDEAAGRQRLVQAAHGGIPWAARRLAYFASAEGDAAAAERWLLAPVWEYDSDAILQVAELYEGNPAGIQGNAETAASIYRSMAEVSAEARRRLARMAMAGTGTKKDPAEARRLLLQDAEHGDHASEAQLGMAILGGELGEVDEAEGRKWMQRAIAGGDKHASDSLAFWLFYRKNTAASRQEGLALWRKALLAHEDGVANNLAWALCTSPFDDVRNPKAGMEAVAEIGADTNLAEIDTVAACHAANGEYEKAKTLQRDVIAQYEKVRVNQAAARAGAKSDEKVDASVEAQMQEFRDRLALYASGNPYLQLSDKE
jgi:TPR repeat protein